MFRRKHIIYLIVVFLSVTAIYGTLYVQVQNGNLTVEQIKEHATNYWFVYVFIIVGIYVVYTYFPRFWKKDSIAEKEGVKDLVSPEVAKGLWKNIFIEKTRMPHRICYKYKVPKIYTASSEDLVLRNSQTFADRTTGVPFVFFEAHAKTGRLRGISSVLLRLDNGLKYIEESWASNIQEHTPKELFKLNRKMPLTTAQEESVRVELYKASLREEGYEEHELKGYDSLKVQRTQPEYYEPAPLAESHGQQDDEDEEGGY